MTYIFVIEVIYFVVKFYKQKSLWCPEKEPFFTYNVMPKSTFTLCQRNIEIRASTSEFNLSLFMAFCVSHTLPPVGIEKVQFLKQTNNNHKIMTVSRRIKFWPWRLISDTDTVILHHPTAWQKPCSPWLLDLLTDLLRDFFICYLEHEKAVSYWKTRW